MVRTNCFSLQIIYSHLLFLCGLSFSPLFFVCCVTRRREAKHVCRCTGAEWWMDRVRTVIKQGEWGVLAFLFDLYQSASAVRLALDEATASHRGSYVQSFWPLIELWSLPFSSQASDGFPKGQLEVPSSHIVCLTCASGEIGAFNSLSRRPPAALTPEKYTVCFSDRILTKAHSCGLNRDTGFQRGAVNTRSSTIIDLVVLLQALASPQMFFGEKGFNLWKNGTFPKH